MLHDWDVYCRNACSLSDFEDFVHGCPGLRICGPDAGTRVALESGWLIVHGAIKARAFTALPPQQICSEAVPTWIEEVLPGAQYLWKFSGAGSGMISWFLEDFIRKFDWVAVDLERESVMLPGRISCYCGDML